MNLFLFCGLWWFTVESYNFFGGWKSGTLTDFFFNGYTQPAKVWTDVLFLLWDLREHMAKHTRHTFRSGSPRHEPNRFGINGDHPWTRLTGKHDHDLGIMRALGIIGFVSVLGDSFLGYFLYHGIELYHYIKIILLAGYVLVVTLFSS